MNVLVLKDSELATNAVDKMVSEFLVGIKMCKDVNAKQFSLNFPEELSNHRIDEVIDFSKYQSSAVGTILAAADISDTIVFACGLKDTGVPQKTVNMISLLGKYLKSQGKTDKKIIVFWISEGIYSEVHSAVIQEVSDRALWGFDRQCVYMYQIDALFDNRFEQLFDEKKYYVFCAGMDFAMNGVISDVTCDELKRKILSDKKYAEYRKSKILA